MTRKKQRYAGKKVNRGNPTNFSGQHLLHNKKLLNEIISQVNIANSDTVLELGAGKGALTTLLNQRAAKVVAVEYDVRYVEALKQKPLPNTTIIQQDILNLRFPKEKFIVVASIPYSITTPIMKMLLNKPSSGFQRGVLVLEKGAAKRFTSDLVKDSYIAAWRMYFDISCVRGISRKNFSPPPRVDSAIMTINRKAVPIVPLKDYIAFYGLAEFVLKEPSLSLDTALRGVFTPPQIKHVKRTLGLQQDVPVAALSEIQWGVIYEAMVQHVPRFRWPKVKKEKLNHF
ncbi:23S ribosomal RNA methyltransferase Erm [Alteribacillus sp. HJP-4]|uniref:23S ribosomal RNA methyltransferase Erm n=1 Tax=Alteribacillus sp. HJP-4 TaxID=2775394 RepID=UPI0035CCE3B1